MQSNIKPTIFTDEQHLQNLEKFLNLYQKISDFQFQDKKAISVCFLVDVTGSMQKYVAQVKDQIQNIYDEIKQKSNKNAEIFMSLLIGYQNRMDKQRYESLQFTKSVDEFQKFIANLTFIECENKQVDVKIGFEQVLNLKWNLTHLNILIWITDSPYQGKFFHSQRVKQNNQLAHEIQIDLLLKQLCELQIEVYFSKINKSTDVKKKKFNKYMVNYSNFLQEYKFQSKYFFKSISLNNSNQRQFEKKKLQKIILENNFEQKLIQENEIKNFSEIELIESIFNVYKFKLNYDSNKIDLQSEEEMIIDISKLIIGQETYKDVYLGRNCDKGIIYTLKKYKNSNKFDFDNLITEYYVYLIAKNIRNSFTNDFQAKSDSKQQSNQKLYLDDQWIIQSQTSRTYYLMELFKSGYINCLNIDDKVIQKSPQQQNFIQSFQHYSFEYSNYSYILSDILGFGNTINDITIHSQKFMDSYQNSNLKPQLLEQFQNQKQLNMLQLRVNFPIYSNLGSLGVALFFNEHKCNSYCKILNLKTIKEYQKLVPQKKLVKKVQQCKNKEEQNSQPFSSFQEQGQQSIYQQINTQKRDEPNITNQTHLKDQQMLPSLQNLQVLKQPNQEIQIKDKPKLEDYTSLKQNLDNLLQSKKTYSQIPVLQQRLNYVYDKPKTPIKKNQYSPQITSTQNYSILAKSQFNQTHTNYFPKIENQSLLKRQISTSNPSKFRVRNFSKQKTYQDYINDYIIEKQNSKSLLPKLNMIKQQKVSYNLNEKQKIENQIPLERLNSPEILSKLRQNQSTKIQKNQQNSYNYRNIDNQIILKEEQNSQYHTLLQTNNKLQNLSNNQNLINEKSTMENQIPQEKLNQTLLSSRQRQNQSIKILKSSQIDGQVSLNQGLSSQSLSPLQRYNKQIQNNLNQIKHNPKNENQISLKEESISPSLKPNQVQSKDLNLNKYENQIYDNPIVCNQIPQREIRFQTPQSSSTQSQLTKIQNQQNYQINDNYKKENLTPIKSRIISPIQRDSIQSKLEFNQNYMINNYKINIQININEKKNVLQDNKILQKEILNQSQPLSEQKQTDLKKLQINENQINDQHKIGNLTPPKNPITLIDNPKMNNQISHNERLNSPKISQTQRNIQELKKQQDYPKIDNLINLKEQLNTKSSSCLQRQVQQLKCYNYHHQINNNLKFDYQSSLKVGLYQPSLPSAQSQCQLTSQKLQQNQISFYPKIENQTIIKEKLISPSNLQTQKNDELLKKQNDQNKIRSKSQIDNQTLMKQRLNTPPTTKCSVQTKQQSNQNQIQNYPKLDNLTPLKERKYSPLHLTLKRSDKILEQQQYKNSVEQQTILKEKQNSLLNLYTQKNDNQSKIQNNENKIGSKYQIDNQTLMKERLNKAPANKYSIQTKEQSNQNQIQNDPKLDNLTPLKERQYSPSFLSLKKNDKILEQSQQQQQYYKNNVEQIPKMDNLYYHNEKLAQQSEKQTNCSLENKKIKNTINDISQVCVQKSDVSSKIQQNQNIIKDIPKSYYQTLNKERLNSPSFTSQNVLQTKSLAKNCQILQERPSTQHLKSQYQDSEDNLKYDNTTHFKERQFSPSFLTIKRNDNNLENQYYQNPIKQLPKASNLNSQNDNNEKLVQQFQNEKKPNYYLENQKVYTKYIPEASNKSQKQKLNNYMKIEVNETKYENTTLSNDIEKQQNRNTIFYNKNQITLKNKNEETQAFSSIKANENKQNTSLAKKLISCLKRCFGLKD
ncbi:hypothetical protein ABPG74_001796 [Tetrahymena malaccensis]